MDSKITIDNHSFVFTTAYVQNINDPRSVMYVFKCKYCDVSFNSFENGLPVKIAQKCISDEEKIIKDILE